MSKEKKVNDFETIPFSETLKEDFDSSMKEKSYSESKTVAGKLISKDEIIQGIIISEKIIMAIDLGGTTCKCSLANDKGEIFYDFITITARGHQVLVKLYEDCLKVLKVLEIDYSKIAVVAIGCKGAYDSEKGVILNAQGIGWFNYPAFEVAKEIFKKKIIFSNDSQSACYGEWKKGAGRPYKNFVCLTLGTGIGAGVVLNDQIYAGAHNMAGEIGHGGFMQMDRDCDCGLSYCIEGLSSATGIEWYFDRFIARNPESSLSILKNTLGRKVTLRDATHLIIENRTSVIRALRYALKPLASRISLLMYILDVEAFIIGGGPSVIGQPLLDAIDYWLKQCMVKQLRSKFVLKIAELKNQAGVIGLVEMSLEYLASKKASGK